MKIFVSTRETQGWRDNDFCWVPEGEPVLILPPLCDKERDEEGRILADGPCGCGRSFTGTGEPRGTTTARVVDMPELTRAAFAMMLLRAEALVWYISGLDALEAIVDNQLSMVKGFDAGDIVELRGETIQERPLVEVR